MAYFGEFWGAKFKVCNWGYSHWRSPTKILRGVSPTSRAGLMTPVLTVCRRHSLRHVTLVVHIVVERRGVSRSKYDAGSTASHLPHHCRLTVHRLHGPEGDTSDADEFVAENVRDRPHAYHMSGIGLQLQPLLIISHPVSLCTSHAHTQWRMYTRVSEKNSPQLTHNLYQFKFILIL